MTNIFSSCVGAGRSRFAVVDLVSKPVGENALVQVRYDEIDTQLAALGLPGSLTRSRHLSNAGRAMSLADDYEAISLDMIRRYVAERKEEHLSLEFKRTASSDLSEINDRKNFATALSGFANADGGLIVWGIGTTRLDKVDTASSENPIPDVVTFVGRLNEFTGILVNPRVGGVLHRRIQGSGDAGFAVSLVPASDSGPHMAKAGIDRYLRRHGDRFLAMEHYEVADLFGRRPRAKLDLEWSVRSGGSESSRRFARVELKLTNRGRGPASAPFLAITTDENSTEIEHRGLTRITRQNDGLMQVLPVSDGSVALVGAHGLILPPGPTFEVVNVILTFPLGKGVAPRRITCHVAAENAPYETVTIDLSREQIASVLPSTP